jgi:hypothetical protein
MLTRSVRRLTPTVQRSSGLLPGMRLAGADDRPSGRSGRGRMVRPSRIRSLEHVATGRRIWLVSRELALLAGRSATGPVVL